MNNFYTYMVLIFALLFSVTIKAQNLEHLLELNLQKNTSNTNIEILSTTTLFPANSHSELYESNIDVTHQNQIRLHRFDQAEFVELEFYIQKENKELKAGFQEFDNPSGDYFLFEFLPTVDKVRIISNGFTGPSFDYNSNTNFRITKCDNGIIFMVDNQNLKIFPLNASISRYESIVSIDAADPQDMLINFKILNDCSLANQVNRYATLNTCIPQNETLLDNGMLRFYYLEKYAIVEGENDYITVSAYNDEHHPLSGFPMQLPNKQGSNFQEIHIGAGGIGHINFNNYSIKVENANKGLVYYLRISDY